METQRAATLLFGGGRGPTRVLPFVDWSYLLTRQNVSKSADPDRNARIHFPPQRSVPRGASGRVQVQAVCPERRALGRAWMPAPHGLRSGNTGAPFQQEINRTWYTSIRWVPFARLLPGSKDREEAGARRLSPSFVATLSSAPGPRGLPFWKMGRLIAPSSTQDCHSTLR